MAAMAKYMYGAIEESARSRGQFCDSLKTHKRTVTQILKKLKIFWLFRGNVVTLR